MAKRNIERNYCMKIKFDFSFQSLANYLAKGWCQMSRVHIKRFCRQVRCHNWNVEDTRSRTFHPHLEAADGLWMHANQPFSSNFYWLSTKSRFWCTQPSKFYWWINEHVGEDDNNLLHSFWFEFYLCTSNFNFYNKYT